MKRAEMTKRQSNQRHSRKMSRSKKLIDQIDQKTAERLLAPMLPSIILPLIREKVIRTEHLASAEKLESVFAANLDKAIKKWRWNIAIEETFIEEAVSLWKKRKKEVAIVLYASAVEQYLNQSYRLMLEAHGADEQDITKIIRTLNIDAKLSWLLKLITKKDFPKGLAKRLRAVFDLRNAIVHFKAIAGHPDSATDSHARIEAGLKGLGRLSLVGDYRKLQDAMWKIVLEKDPDIDLAIKAAEVFMASSKRRDSL